MIKQPLTPLLTALVLSSLAAGAQAQHLAVQEVPLTANHVLYDSMNGKVYASIPSTAALNPNTVAQINAATGAVESYIMVGSDPDVLALSSDGSYLYVGIDGASSVARIVLASNTVDQQFSLGTAPLAPQYTYHAANIVPLPGTLQSVAVTRDYFGVSPANAGVVIYDNGVPRPNTTPYYVTIGSLVASNSSNRLYGYDNEDTGFDFYQLNVDANGINVGQKSDSFGTGILQGFNAVIRFDKGNGLVYATNGTVVDPAALTHVGAYPISSSLSGFPSNIVDVMPSDSENRVYFLAGAANSSYSNAASLAVYNQSTFQQSALYTTSQSYLNVGDLSEISPAKFVFRTNTGVEFATPQALSSITITAAASTLAAGKTDQFTATAAYPDGTTSDVTSAATWSSDNTAVATINSAGLAQGAASGTANITATVNGITSSPLALTVTPAHYAVLWNNADGRASVWNYNADSGTFTQNTFGPYPGWTAKAVAQSENDELIRVLWGRTDGTVSLWQLDNTTGTFAQDTYGPYAGWTANAIAVSPFNYGSFGNGNATQNNLLWNNSGTGQSSLWDQNFDTFASFNFYPIGPFYTFGPPSGWSAQSLARSPYGQPLVLEDNADGRMTVLNSNNSASYSQLNSNIYGPYPGWTAVALSAGASTANTLTAHVLWTNTDGHMSLWNYDYYGTFTQNTYGPYPNWSAKAIADGSDGKTLVLWDNTGGAASLWSLDNTAGVFTQHTFGPYPGWTATAVSGN